MGIQIIFMVCSSFICMAQTVEESDTNRFPPAFLNASDSTQKDSLILQTAYSDSTYIDSLGLQTEISDSATIDAMPISPNAVTAIVDYFAQDSVEFNIRNKKALLFNNTELLYEDIELKSHYVDIDFSKNELHAEGIPDTNQTLQGTPVFKQGDYVFKCHELDYNFTSKKGLIKNVITQEGEGYLHGEIVKKNADNSSFIHKGKYTTCNLEHPHFEMDFFKAKVIPNDKIVTGPLYLRVANIPTFLALPFAFFPNSNKRTNGLLMPTYGVHNTLGIHFTGLGYYFAIKDIMDFAITADVYMQAAFGVGLRSRYVKRYKSNGNFEIKYNHIPSGERTTEEYRVSKELKISWHHQQDRKAHPTNSFSANIDFQTSGYRNSTANIDYGTYTQSTSYSTVSFNTSFKSRYALGINANISQNLTTGYLGLDLPQINFNVQQFYPLRRKKTVGKLRWYEEISMQYTVNMKNGINTIDSILLKSPHLAFRTFNSELNQNIPIKSTIKLFKYISWNNSVVFNEIWNMKGDSLSCNLDSIIDNKEYFSVHHDTMYGFFTTHNLTYNSDLSTTLYGMYIMKKSRVYAFRHTFMPSIGFSYRPGINQKNYKTYYDSIQKRDIEYYITNHNPGKTSASTYITFNNKLEMKVRKKKKKDDDEEEFKKVTLLESFSIRTAYDFMRDSLRLDPISINGRTLIFKYINLNFDLRLDPYAYDDVLGTRINVFEWNAKSPLPTDYYDDSLNTTITTTRWVPNRRLLRLSSTSWDISCGLNLDKNFFKPKNKEDAAEIPTYGFKDWNISVNYTFSYNMVDNPLYYRYQRVDTVLLKYTHKFNNTLNINGRIAITPKWAFDFYSGYDITNKQIAVSEFSIERDLHCWLMKFTWVPFGVNRRFEFLIQAKANMLKDVKWNPTYRQDDF